ncbi:MAG: glycosyltransferase family 1 protein [Verrucomicrobiota bacterium]
MRIAFDHQIFTQQRFGGISRYFAELVPRLKNLGETPRVFAGLHKNEYLRHLDPDLIRGRFTPEPSARLQQLRFRVNECYAKRGINQWKPDLVHETYFRSKPSAPAGTPTVFTVYDMIHEYFPEDFPSQNLESLVKREAVEFADHVICISHNTRNDLIRLFDVDEAKVSVVHLAFEGSDFDNLRASQPSRPYFLFVGHRAGYKNFDRFLEAGERSGIQRDFDIVAFGSDPLSIREREQMASRGYKPDQVRHVRGSDQVLADLYRSAHALVYPSIYEGFGLPPLEAMAQRCPVISSNTSSMPEVIGEAAEFFDPVDVDDMTRALSLIASSDSRRSELIAKGLERIKKFSWDKTAVETREVYKKVLQ